MPIRQRLSFAYPGWLLKKHSTAPTSSVDEHSTHVPASDQSSGFPVKLKDQVPQGILFMVAATVLFAISNAIAKWEVATYPVGEVMFFRSLSSLAVCAVVMLPFTGMAVFATNRPGAHIARGLSQSISQTLTVIAFSLMPLAGATAINFSAPL